MKTKVLKIFEEMQDALNAIPNEELGQLFKDMMAYRFQGIDKRRDDLGWRMIKGKIDASVEWDKKISSIRSQNGKKGGRPRKNEVEKVVVMGEEITLKSKNRLNV